MYEEESWHQLEFNLDKWNSNSNRYVKLFWLIFEFDFLDDEAAMDFVVACSNIRSFIYNIPQKTRFDVKSMAGNIIPAIATTNAVIAGGIVMEALKIINVSFILIS